MRHEIDALWARVTDLAAAVPPDVEALRRQLADLAALVAAGSSASSAAAADRLHRLAADLAPSTVAATLDEARSLVGDPDEPSAATPAGSGPADPSAADDDEIAGYVADPELAGMFVTDAIDHLGTIEAVVLNLEAAPGDAKLLNDLFRPFHTVKGNAGVLGFTSIQGLAHKVETLLDLARSGRHALGAPEIDVVLKAVDLLTLMTQELPVRAAGQPGTDVTERRRALMEAVDALIATGGSAPPASDEQHAAVVSHAPAAASRPPAAVSRPPAAPAQPPAWDPQTPQRRWDDTESTVKVNTRKLDSVVDLVGELVIAHSILAEDPAITGSGDDRLNRQFAHIKRITSELQRHAMAMRMVPIRRTFQKMTRLVRDLSHMAGKNVDLILSGEDTELDRKVVESLSDPLMHMVRNTIDHGIELPEARAAAGKPAQAELRVSASHQAGAIVIEIADDGAGLDTEKILERAIAQGLVAEGETLPPADIHQLIFRPGFSTADRVTEISGRGVGMDVVRRNVEALRGCIEIRTARGVGTTFTLRLPLTLATVDGLLLGVAGERFVIPTFAVRESLRPSEGQVHSVSGRACIIQLRDRLIPLLHLGQAFDIGGARSEATDATVVVIEDNGRRAALVVDELLGKQEVVIKSLGDAFQGVRGVAGGAILGDGRIGLILDVGGLLSMIDRNAMPAVA